MREKKTKNELEVFVLGLRLSSLQTIAHNLSVIDLVEILIISLLLDTMSHKRKTHVIYCEVFVKIQSAFEQSWRVTGSFVNACSSNNKLCKCQPETEMKLKSLIH